MQKDPCSRQRYLETWSPIWKGLSGLRPSPRCDHHPQGWPWGLSTGNGVASTLPDQHSLCWGPGPRFPCSPAPSLSSVPSQGLQLQLQPSLGSEASQRRHPREVGTPGPGGPLQRPAPASVTLDPGCLGLGDTGMRWAFWQAEPHPGKHRCLLWFQVHPGPLSLVVGLEEAHYKCKLSGLPQNLLD